MEKVKDTERIKQMLQNGESVYTDPENEYKYSLFASCPNDGFECPAKRFEREGMDMVVKTSKITKVVFQCPICGKIFYAEPEDIYLM